MRVVRNLSIASIVTIFLSVNAQATIITAINLADGNALNDITTWVNNISPGGSLDIIEGFDGVSSESWLDTYNSSSLGEFSIPVNAEPGSGQSSYYSQVSGVSPDDKKFLIHESSNYYGRKSHEGNYLDSADVTRIELDLINDKFKDLAFYFTDPFDVGGLTIFQVGGVSYQFTPQNNGSEWFIGVSSTSYLDKFVWSVGHSNDGWGVDSFAQVQPVPEPATMLLFGTGIAGLVGLRMRRKSK